MRRSKEIIVLLALLVSAMAFVLWYVIDRRARNRAAAAASARSVAPAAPSAAAPLPGPTAPGTTTVLPDKEPVVLGTAVTERKTIDFSTGTAVVKDSAEDKAAIDAAMKDIAEASRSVSFDDPPKPPAQPAATK